MQQHSHHAAMTANHHDVRIRFRIINTCTYTVRRHSSRVLSDHTLRLRRHAVRHRMQTTGGDGGGVLDSGSERIQHGWRTGTGAAHTFGCTARQTTLPENYADMRPACAYCLCVNTNACICVCLCVLVCAMMMMCIWRAR